MLKTRLVWQAEVMLPTVPAGLQRQTQNQPSPAQPSPEHVNLPRMSPAQRWGQYPTLPRYCAAEQHHHKWNSAIFYIQLHQTQQGFVADQNKQINK